MKPQPVVIKGSIRLKHFDPGYSDGLNKEKARARTKEHWARIGELQQLLYANSRHAVLLLFQGMDASGKDGSIRNVLQHVNPAGVETMNFKVPSDEERAHDFLWRHHKAIPRLGNIGVFNRSHYEAVLAERVLGIVPLKFCLFISRREQAVRFRARLADPHKHWKFSQADLTTRQHWDDYIDAYEDMLNATSHRHARWNLVPADHNWYRDFVVARTVVRALEALKMKWPKSKQDFSKIRFK